MRKVTIVGLQENRDRMLTVLHDLRAIQVEPLGQEALSYFVSEKGGSVERAIAEETLRFKTLASALPPVEVRTREHFPDTRSLLQAAKSVTIDKEVHELKRKEDGLITLRENLGGTRRMLHEFSFFNEDLSLLQAKSVFSFFGSLPVMRYGAFRDETAVLSKDSYVSSPTLDGTGKIARFVVVVPREKAEAFAKLTQKHGARLAAVPPELKGTPASAIKQLDARLATVINEIEEVSRKLLKISVEWYQKVLPIKEELEVEARKAEVIGRLGKSQTCFALEGWVPARELPRLNSELGRVTRGQYYVSVSDMREGAPTLLTNPKGIKVYEFFIRFYSLPQSKEIDPTFIFSIVFPIFFGMMLGDAGYGTTILVISLWLIWRIGNPNAGKTWVPRSLTRFITVIVPPPVIKQLAKALVPGCMIAIALGVMFDQYFGFSLAAITFGHLSLPSSLHYNLMTSTHIGQLLVLAGYIGIALVTLGLVFGIVNGYILRHWKYVASKVSWILVAWGVALLGLVLIHYGSVEHLSALSPTAHFSGVYEAMVVVGISGILASEGGLALMELPTMISHVLSYTRLIGILFASVILALVIDTISMGWIHTGSPDIFAQAGFIIAGLVLLVFGQMFNLVIGVFEPSIQGVRLLYVEHFSKYYTGNGRPFTPFGTPRKYTRPQLTEHLPKV
jgi:V/A-type H+-transporting ATPase subunit I